MERPISFFLMLFILLFAGTGFIFVVFGLQGFSFVFELGLLLAFMFILTFAMFLIYHDKEKSWGIMAGVMILLLLDVFMVLLISRKFGLSYITTMIFAAAGFIVALLNLMMMRKEKKEIEVKPHYEKPKYYYPFVEKTEQKEEANKENVVTTFTPGKFVASKKANKFHSPKCDWAQRIEKENQVWFDSKEEAQSKGFEADRCIV